MTMPRLIGITGLAGAGKDTLAEFLVTQFGFVRYGLADPIKRVLEMRFGWRPNDWDNRSWKEAPSKACGHRDVNYGVNCFSPRSWAQWLGTEAGRAIHGDDCWVTLMLQKWELLNSDNTETFGELPRMVVSDVRFDNEARAIRNAGGIIIRVTRAGAAPVEKHVSEAGVADFMIDVTIPNNGSIGDFLGKAAYTLLNVPILRTKTKTPDESPPAAPTSNLGIDEYADFIVGGWTKHPQDESFDRSCAVAALGLGGESGEVTEHFKKYLRGTHELDTDEIELELGDVLAYWTKCCNLAGTTPQRVMKRSMEKIKKRRDTETVLGVGRSRSYGAGLYGGAGASQSARLQ